MKYQSLIDEIYPFYIAPILEGKLGPNDAGKLLTNIQKKMHGVLAGLVAQSTSIILPKYCKMLLISCYLASWNPPSSDYQIFSKCSKKTKKRKKETFKKRVPVTFCEQRVFAIFYSLVDIGDSCSTSFLLNSLIELGFVAKVSKGLNDIKYKVAFGKSMVDQLAKECKFDLSGYLLVD